MNVVHDEVANRVITRAIGDQLRRAREDIGWSQADLAARIPSGLHVKTLATYEQGSRQCSVVRLVEICRTLGVAAPDLLGLALQHAEVDLQTVGLQVDLHAVVRDTRDELRTLRRWARNRLAINPESGVARLDSKVVQDLAALAGFALSDLVRYLELFTPSSASS